MKKLLLPLTAATLLCSANAYALKVSFRTGPTIAPDAETYDYEIEYTRDDKFKKPAKVTKVEYLWTIEGLAFKSHEPANGMWTNINIASVTMAKLDKEDWTEPAPENRWKGSISCTVKVFFSNGKIEVASQSIQVSLVANHLHK